jgi:oligopeptide/dipeptide ABC transporter ATP-binding protein
VAELLEVTGLEKRYHGRRRRRPGETVQAVKDVSFTLSQGETLAVVGESGAGKSTLGMMLLRLVEPDGGSIRFDGEDLLALGRTQLRRWRRHAQMVFQDPFGSFDPRMTIGASLAEPLVLHADLSAKARAEAVSGLVERVGLDPSALHRFPYEFSGGQLQRMAIARAIATRPKLLVCDEPVAALDVSIRAQVLNLLHQLQREIGTSMVFISHDLSIVRVVADRVMVMYKGSVVELGPTAAVYDNPRHPYTKALLAAVPVPDPRRQRRRSKVIVPLAPSISAEGCSFSLRCPHAMDVCRLDPPLLAVAPGVEVACHLYSGSTTDPIAPAVGQRPSLSSPNERESHA